MFKGRSIEFFEGDNGRLSMTRLLCYISIFPASYELHRIKTENALLYYLGAYVLGYIGGKGAEAWSARSPQQSGTQTITRTEVKSAVVDPGVVDLPANDVNIKAAGDVSVTKSRKKK